MSSAMRNAIKRKTHKERAQPKNRRHLGLLEKHKDYVVRARDYHIKKKRVKALALKAQLKNPDEFYFGMISARTKDGVHQVETKTASVDVANLVKTQDALYLQTKRQEELRKIEKLKQSVNFIPKESEDEDIKKEKARVLKLLEKYSGKRGSLAGNKEEEDQEGDNFDDDDEDDDDGEEEDEDSGSLTLKRPRHVVFVDGRPREVQPKEKKRKQDSESNKIRPKEHPSAALSQLKLRLDRVEKISNAIDHLNTHRKLFGKGSKTKIKEASGNRPAQYRWADERKR